MRIRDHAEDLPKPLVHIGYRPVLWHVMKYYAHFGHKDFILCLGYKADAIKHYFLNYDECLSNDFMLSGGSRRVQLVSQDINDWKITFVDTGIHANIGERLKAVERYLEGDDIFLANYSDGLTDVPLPQQLQHFQNHGKIGSFLCVKPRLSYHMVTLRDGGIVSGIYPMTECDLRINGGYFIFRREIFDHLLAKEDLVREPFQRLVHQHELLAYVYDGFWAAMDTFKDKQQLEDLYSTGIAPWEVWKHARSAGLATAA